MKTKIISYIIVLFWVGFWGCASTQSREALNLYNKGDSAYKNEKYNDALEYFEKSLNIYKSIGYDKGTASTLHYIGNIYRLHNKYDIALIYYEDALKIDRKLKIPKNISTVLHEIGLVYSSLDKYDEALKYYEESIKINKELNDPKSEATTLGAIAGVYSSLGQYDKALSYYEEALRIDRKLGIPKSIAIDLNNIGSVYASIGKYDKALGYFEESLKIKREHKLSSQNIATSLGNIGSVYSSLGQYEKALSYYEDVLKIDRELNIPQSIALSLNNIGSVYDDLGQYEKALTYHEEALKIYRDIKTPQDIAMSLNNIGSVYASLGQYEKAMSYHEESLKIKRENKLSPQDIATSLNNIGAVYNSIGQYEKVLSYFEESLKIFRETNVPLDIATSLNNIGLIYASLGQYEKALSYYDESLKIKRQNNLSPESIATSLNNIGEVYNSLGQYEKALSYHEESLKIKRELKIPQSIATSLNNIGLVYTSLGQYEKALSYFEEVLKIDRQLNIPQDIALSLNNIGLVYLSLKDYQKAEGLFKEAEKEDAKTEGKWLGGNPALVDLYIATGRHDEALKLLKDMTPRWFDAPPYQIQYHTKQGLSLKGAKRLNEAGKEFLKAVTITEEMRQKVKGEKTGFLGAGSAGGRIRAYRGLFSTLAERAIKGDNNPLTPFNKGEFSPYGKDLSSSAFYFAESTKGRTLLEAMAESARKSQKAEIPEGIREKEQSILNQLSAIENQWDDAYKRGEDVLRSLKERKDGLNVELNNLITELRQKYPRYAALNYPKPIPPEELPLKDNEVLLEYAIGDDAGYLFVVRKGGIRKLIKIPFSREELEAKVKAFIEPMNTKHVERFSVKEARELYEILLAEAMKEINPPSPPFNKGGNHGSPSLEKGDVGGFLDRKIIIVPDGILGLLPFESLIVKEGKDYKDSLYVGDRYQISYYQSATVLALQRNLKERKTERPLFALGNPIYTKEDPRYLAWKESVRQAYDEKPLKVANLDKYSFRDLAIEAKWGKTTEADTTGKMIEFRPLPETEIEVKEIAKTMGVLPEPPDILLSVAANETELKKTGFEGYKYIHFATHASLPGMIQGINEPFILLGQVENKDKDDGFLTLSEVLDLRLNADMVVLSACVTGVGKEVEGEGVANFARAFQHAGAKSIVVSLWAVASDPAVEYMEKFYGYLKAGKDRGEAMRLARNGIKAKYPNPFYWAVFILHGEG